MVEEAYAQGGEAAVVERCPLFLLSPLPSILPPLPSICVPPPSPPTQYLCPLSLRYICTFVHLYISLIEIVGQS